MAKRLTTHFIDEWLLNKETTLVTMYLIRESGECNPLPDLCTSETISSVSVMRDIYCSGVCTPEEGGRLNYTPLKRNSP